jgi:hypothetical protein
MGFTNPLTGAQLAAALAATTLTVTGQVTTTTSTDEDEVRPYTQAQINALTAADKNTNFLIYNTTTSSLNYCVNGNIIVPPAAAAGVQKASGTYTGDGTTGRAISVGFAPDLVLVFSGNNSYAGFLTRTDSTYRQAFFLSGSSTAGQNTDQLTASGFTVNTQINYLNINTVTYTWSAYKFS